jgi:hypothetical protein
MAGFCEHGNETSVSIKEVVYCLTSDKLSDCQFFKEYPAPRTE